ncbi:MAG: phosphate ABC transporter permease subunit PstC [Candidatus Thorarchaeota archaeon]
MSEEQTEHRPGTEPPRRSVSILVRSHALKMLRGLGHQLRSIVTAFRVGGGARLDLIGRASLFIPALAGLAIIVLILSFLWYESIPIFTDPNGGPGILVQPVWDPPRNLYGIAIFIVGSLICTALAILLAVPLGIGAATFLSEFCPSKLRNFFRSIVELMAGIPSIVYGLWAYVVLVPWIRNSLAPFLQSFPLTSWMPWFQGTTNGLSMLAGGLILGIMLLPTVVAISNDALESVSDTYREAAYALGANRSETARKVVLSAALPGVGASIVLSLGRAVGETMAVLMVTGNSLSIPYSLLDPGYVMTSIIANQLGYAYAFPLWRSALFAVALVLLLMSVTFTAMAKIAIRWGMKTRGVVV